MNPVAVYRRFFTRGLPPHERILANLDVAIVNLYVVIGLMLYAVALMIWRLAQ